MADTKLWPPIDMFDAFTGRTIVGEGDSFDEKEDFPKKSSEQTMEKKGKKKSKAGKGEQRVMKTPEVIVDVEEENGRQVWEKSVSETCKSSADVGVSNEVENGLE